MASYLKIMELSEFQLSSVVGGRHYSPNGGGSGGSNGITLPTINVNAPVYLNVNISIINIVDSTIGGNLNIYSAQTSIS